MLDYLAQFNRDFPAFFACVMFVLGSCIGSFLNVIIYRLPRKMSIVRPPSHCFACSKPIRAQDNLPILGWLLLKGKARCCGAPFSPRYAVIELLTGLLFLIAWLRYEPAVALCMEVFICWLIIGTFIDLDTQELPDVTTVGGAALGLMASMAVPALQGKTDPEWIVSGMRAVINSTIGMFVGSATLLWIGMFTEKLFRKETMGFGDCLLMGCIGAFIGWKGSLFALFGGTMTAVLVLSVLYAVNAFTGLKLKPGKVEKATPLSPDGKPLPVPEAPQEQADEAAFGIGSTIPFGPWLSAGALIYALGPREAIDRFFESAISVLY